MKEKNRRKGGVKGLDFGVNDKGCGGLLPPEGSN